MLAKAFSAAVIGLDAHLVEVEADIGVDCRSFPWSACRMQRSEKAAIGFERH
jgi:hypothetical protein